MFLYIKDKDEKEDDLDLNELTPAQVESKKVRFDTLVQKDQKRKDLKKKLMLPDAILESDVFETLSKWLHVEKGVRTAAIGSAVEMLSQSYKGYPDMIHLLIRWISLLDDEKSEEGSIPGTPNGSSPKNNNSNGNSHSGT